MSRLQTIKPRVAPAPTRGRVIEADSWRADKRTAAQRGYDARWRAARLVFLRAHPLCAECEREGRVIAANVVDHIVPHRGDQVLFWDRENWAPLCGECHRAKTARGE